MILDFNTHAGNIFVVLYVFLTLAAARCVALQEPRLVQGVVVLEHSEQIKGDGHVDARSRVHVDGLKLVAVHRHVLTVCIQLHLRSLVMLLIYNFYFILYPLYPDYLNKI